MAAAPTIGVLALQGDFEAHARMLRDLGAKPVKVRAPNDLAGLDALVIPGGESTTMTLGIEREGLAEPLRALVAAGTPVLGTCAGLIVLDREHLGLLDVRARRNAFGRQTQSFEVDVRLDGFGREPMRAVFIRAPWMEEIGDGVHVLAELGGRPIAVARDDVLAVAFHPELTDDSRLHEWLVARARGRESAEGPASQAGTVRDQRAEAAA